MEKSALVASGSGYADDRSFDPFTVVAFPLPTRESRILGRDENGHNGTCYGSHEIKLAVRTPVEGQPSFSRGRESCFYILVRHGGGSRVVEVQGTYGDKGAMIEALKALPELALYSLLHGIYSAVDQSIYATARDTARKWMQAAIDKRIKIGRVKQGSRRVEIIPVADPLAP